MIVDSPERYWAKVDKDGPTPDYAPHLGNCWEWTAAKDSKGYGTFWSGNTDRKTLTAHRVGHFLATGEDIDGLDLDHLCRRPACVNPHHLDPVSRSVNASRGEKSWDFTGLCPRGHNPEVTGERVDKDGRRRCRECIRERARKNHALYGRTSPRTPRKVVDVDEQRRKWREASRRHAARKMGEVVDDE